MARIAEPFTIVKRENTFQFTLNPTCGLPQRVCAEWPPMKRNRSEIDHNSTDQLKRQKAISNKNLAPVSIDTELQTGIFEGSVKNYNVSLHHCECADFSIRKSEYPCKHMYRLVHELGYFDLSTWQLKKWEGLHGDAQFSSISSCDFFQGFYRWICFPGIFKALISLIRQPETLGNVGLALFPSEFPKP